ncbi:GMP synthase [glutamine-hydrolyzing] [Rickettsiales bacterium Ac37b]|nr:GMP synthase [glutamine-hydrolyzing] [Rickettsiales bacterium Ac37b]
MLNIDTVIDKVLILDFGSQVTQLIARRIREYGIYSEIKLNNITIEEVKKFNPKAIILSGGPASVLEQNSPTLNKEILSLGIPILGICYGQQIICHLLGGEVEKAEHREFGRTSLHIIEDSILFDNVWTKGQQHDVWMSHGDLVVAIPQGFHKLAATTHTNFAVIANEQLGIYAVQFHPEVTHTINGMRLLENFVIKIAKCNPSWNIASFADKSINEIRNKVGDKKVICGVSGGVDSTVVAILLNKAIGDNLNCIFVDTGLLRKNEVREVKNTFESLGVKLNHIDASELFINSLKGITDPEEKRKIIGKLFIEAFDQEASKLGKIDFLAQGTLYSDVIESSVGHTVANTIKSHHNVGGLPRNMTFTLIEPLRELFKDEVRLLGKELGISDEYLNRHPFPGPGLAVRIPGEVTKEKISMLQNADYLFIESLKKAGLYDKIWQAFAVLLPVKTVGVMGDGRSYEHVCALRAVTSCDAMTADFFDLPYDFLRSTSNLIINSVKGINRIVYDITSKPPGTIEWE